jgi:hypothetical protein
MFLSVDQARKEEVGLTKDKNQEHQNNIDTLKGRVKNWYCLFYIVLPHIA